jgi:hypothetical protein
LGGVSAGVARPSSLLGRGEQQQQRTPAPPPGADRQQAERDTPFDPAKVTLPENMTADPTLMNEFAGAAKELGIGAKGADKLMGLHAKALEAQNAQLRQTWTSWQETAKRDFGDQLPHVLSDIEQAVGRDRDAQRFYQLMEWSGLGSEPTVLRVLHRLAGGGRGRY